MKIDYPLYGVTYRSFDNWVRQGYIRPEGPTGSGHDRDFTATEMRIFAIMAKLVSIGFKPSAAAELARSTVVKGWSGKLELRAGRVHLFGILQSQATPQPVETAGDTRTG